MKRIYNLLFNGVMVLSIAVLLLLLNSEVTRGQLADSPWPMYRGNLLHTARSPYDTSYVDGSVKWSFDLGVWSESSPVIGPDGTIYIGVHGEFGKLYAIDPNNPTMPKWTFDTGQGLYTWGMWKAIQATPAIAADGTIYLVALDDTLYAINPNGSEQWTFPIDVNENIWSSPAIAPDGTIYVGSKDNPDTPDNPDDGCVYAIDRDGNEIWRFTTQSNVSSSPAIAPDGTIYVGSDNLYAINPDDGTEEWHFPIPIPPPEFRHPDTQYIYTMVESSPAIGTDGTIYVGSAGKMLDQNDNTLKTIGKLYAIDPTTRTAIWSFPSDNYIDAEVWSSPAIALDGTIYFGTGWGTDNNLYAISPNGTQEWAFPTGGSVESSPAIGADGTIYVGSSDRYFYAINPNGTPKWPQPFHTPRCGWVASPAIGADGTIYALNDTLYAFTGPHTVSVPSAPSGPTSVDTGNSFAYITGDSIDSLGHDVEYRFDWGDGTFSPWSSSNSATKFWPSPETYTVRAKARCSVDNSIESNWSQGLTVNAHPICIPLAMGIPANRQPPNWWDDTEPDYGKRIDDPRWEGAVSLTYGEGTGGEAEFRALHKNNNLYLSWHLKVDPTLEDGQDVVYVGFASPSGTPSVSEPDVVIRVTTFTSSTESMEAAPAGATKTFLRTSPGGAWVEASSEPPWLASYLRVWLEDTAPYSWAAHMRVPIITAPGMTVPNDGIKINSTSGNFKMWYEIQMQTAAGTVPYRWPREASMAEGDVRNFPDPSTWAEFHLKTGTSDPAACSDLGVKLTYSNIGTTNPIPHKILYSDTPPRPVNTFYARPENNSGITIPVEGIKASFKIANWGSLPDWEDVTDPSVLWTDIPNTEMGIPNSAIIPGGTLADETNLTFDWTVEGDFLDRLNSGEMWEHQCILVVLTSGLNLTFINNSAWRNMNFETASKLRRDAAISVLGLGPDALGRPNRDVYLYVETVNMPAEVDKQESQQLREKQKEKKLSFEEIVQGMPTYRIHVYHDTGKRIMISGRNYPILRPQSSFGYYVDHEGKLTGWKHSLEGANGLSLTEIAPNFYKIAVPNDGVVTVTTTIEAIEPMFPPWWLIVLILLFLAMVFILWFLVLRRPS